MKTLTYKKLAEDTKKLAESIDGSKYDSLYAIPRGGVPIGILLISGNFILAGIFFIIAELLGIVEELV